MLDICHLKNTQNEALKEGAANSLEPHATRTVWRCEQGRLFPYHYPQGKDNPVEELFQLLYHSGVSRNKAKFWVYSLLFSLLNNHPELLIEGMRSTPAIYSHRGTSLLISRINSCWRWELCFSLVSQKTPNYATSKKQRSHLVSLQLNQVYNYCCNFNPSLLKQHKNVEQKQNQTSYLQESPLLELPWKHSYSSTEGIFLFYLSLPSE